MIVWRSTYRGWPIGTLEVEGRAVGHVCLRPLEQDHPRNRRLLADGVSLPPTHPVYLLAVLHVDPEYRGRGHGRTLLVEGMKKLQELHGTAWLGLMTDNLRHPAGRTRRDIRAVWDGVVNEYGVFYIHDGFLKVTRHAVETLA